METAKGGRMSFIEAVSAEQYLETHSLKAVLQWVTHEVILNKPKSPLAFIRDLLTAKLNQQQGGGKNDIAMLVENAEISLSKCVQAAASSKDEGDRTRAAALLTGLRAKMDQLSEDLAPGKFSSSAAPGSFRDRAAPRPVQTTNLKASGRGGGGGGGGMDLARSLATRGIRNKVTPTIGEEESASNSDDDDDASEPESPQTAHTPPEWKEEPGKSLEEETVHGGDATDANEKKNSSPKSSRMSQRLGHWTMEDRCNAAFSKMDTDNDGLLTRKEFEKALKQIGLNMTPRSMHQLLSKIDKNHDGEISRDEFLEFYKTAREEGGDEMIDLDAHAPTWCCGPGSLATFSRELSSDGEDSRYTPAGHYKYAHLVSWCVHAREGFQRRKHLMGKAKQISSDPDMNNYLKGNPLTDAGHSALSLSLLESRQEGSDPDANAKIINRARANWKIIPEDSWYLCWTLFTMVLILFYMGVVPVRLAFSDYAPDNEFVQGSEGWYWVDFVADTVFLVDIVMNFFVIIKHGNGEYLINFVDIAIFQIHSKWFYVDMVASIPTSYMNYETRDDWDKDDEMLNASADDGAEGGVTQQLSGVNKLLRLVRIIKLARVFRMVRFMKDFEDLAIVNPSSLRLVRLLVFFVIILHFVACGFWMLLSGDHFCQDEDTDHGECSADIAWYIQKGTAENSSLTVQYMMAFYWAVSAMTGVGYDIEPRTYWQHVYTTVIIVCGMFMNAILIGSVPGAIENLDRVQSDRKRELDAINDYLRKQHVPAYLQRSVRSYYEYLHGCDHDMRLGEEERLQSLPESLKTRVKVATAIRAIERIPLFSDLHASCKIQIIHRLNPVIKVPGERLAIQDDVGEAMYIIKNGRVQLKRIPKPKRSANKWLSATEKLRKPVLLGHPVAEKQPETTGSMGDVANTVVREIVKVAELGAGDFFGENCLLGRKNDTTAIAADYSDLLQLTVDDCKELCEEYAELKEQITSTAKSRYLAHVPHEERHDDDIRNLEESIRLERMQEGDVGVPLNGSAPSRLSTRRMTRLLMDEFADLSAQHGILRGMGESKHNGQ